MFFHFVVTAKNIDLMSDLRSQVLEMSLLFLQVWVAMYELESKVGFSLSHREETYIRVRMSGAVSNQ